MATEKHIVQLHRWKVLIQDRMNSNLKISEFCKQNNVSKDAYYYWLRQIQKEIVAEAKSKTNKPAISETNTFVEIQPVVSTRIPSLTNKSKPSAVIRGNGLEIDLYEDTSANFMRKLMEAVKYA
ncbi:MAG: IS66 family insertion sequence element accessory protein TnpB [Oscillospiraceae bacterium]|nr:IS66 family insertion sequence element accessory protein TnpB [Oscillospiraceae bacterium]